MDIEITAEEKQKYLLVQSRGEAQTKESLIEHCDRIKDEILEHDCDRILINEPETKFSKNITDYFEVVKSYVENWPKEMKKLKIAAVVAPEYREFAETWETLCVSRGYPYHAFTSLSEGKRWLLQEGVREAAPAAAGGK